MCTTHVRKNRKTVIGLNSSHVLHHGGGGKEQAAGSAVRRKKTKTKTESDYSIISFTVIDDWAEYSFVLIIPMCEHSFCKSSILMNVQRNAGILQVHPSWGWCCFKETRL
jgi:hypothetical protein